MSMLRGIMEPLLVVALVAWLGLCLVLYRRHRRARWLAASSASACLGLVGITLALTARVPTALCLLPLWASIGLLCLLHLRRALSDPLPAPLPAQPRNEHTTTSAQPFI